ncbi:PREDICTED: uncharacterized protein LOC109220022 [Nicotiana attenuata]|uniref:uncharacterized protein LOC109220022 n=1 Tax=Nicotiana attenuata TaxID=49451 RepID=UPI000904DD20|nr:PREDICTED: uncharacterized protein LOC109220022 [Nicotiana attenuata]
MPRDVQNQSETENRTKPKLNGLLLHNLICGCTSSSAAVQFHVLSALQARLQSWSFCTLSELSEFLLVRPCSTAARIVYAPFFVKFNLTIIEKETLFLRLRFFPNQILPKVSYFPKSKTPRTPQFVGNLPSTYSGYSVKRRNYLLLVQLGSHRKENFLAAAVKVFNLTIEDSISSSPSVEVMFLMLGSCSHSQYTWYQIIDEVVHICPWTLNV